MRTPDGELCCDPSGRRDGRGAYLTLDDDCVQKALTTGMLSKRLSVSIDAAAAAELIAQVHHERMRRLSAPEGVA